MDEHDNVNKIILGKELNDPRIPQCYYFSSRMGSPLQLTLPYKTIAGGREEQVIKIGRKLLHFIM